MHSSDGAKDRGDQIPRLAAGWQPEDVALTPAEGFLISRMDGQTPWEMLRQIGGIEPEQVDDYIERWIESGAVEFVQPTAAAPPEKPDPTLLDVEAEIDTSLDIGESLQRRILDYELRIDGSYHDLLGIERGSDTQTVKRAYFALSKEFHPDRYFRKNIGGFAPRLDSIFKKMIEAYELLSDPTTRAELERSMSAAPEKATGGFRCGSGGSSESGATDPNSAGGYRTPTRMENLEKLRGRFRIPKKLLIERQFKARQLFQAAQVAAHGERWIEAAASVRLAIAFDPWNKEFKSGFADIQSNVHGLRATELLDKAEAAGTPNDAMRLLEEALGYRPMDPVANARAARLALELEEMDRAHEYAETACECEPEVAGHHLILSKILNRLGRFQDSRQALERAAHLDPSDPAVKRERLRVSHLARKR